MRGSLNLCRTQMLCVIGLHHQPFLSQQEKRCVTHVMRTVVQAPMAPYIVIHSWHGTKLLGNDIQNLSRYKNNLLDILSI
jgi:hypothetical protein